MQKFDVYRWVDGRWVYKKTAPAKNGARSLRSFLAWQWRVQSDTIMVVDACTPIVREVTDWPMPTSVRLYS